MINITNQEGKKEFLKEYLKLKRKIESLNLQKKQLMEEKKQAKSQVITDMPRGGKQSDLSDYVCQIEEIEKKIEDSTRRMYIKRLQIEKAIMCLDDGVESDVLRIRYIEGKEWEKICIDINYSWMQTHRIHSRALKNIMI